MGGCIDSLLCVVMHCWLVRTAEHLGSGQFGTVSRGIWQASRGSRAVAIKMLQPSPTGQDTVRFLQEAAIMGQFRHPNIVQLHGVVTIGEPVSSNEVFRDLWSKMHFIDS